MNFVDIEIDSIRFYMVKKEPKKLTLYGQSGRFNKICIRMLYRQKLICNDVKN